jgi:hypothetical protein
MTVLAAHAWQTNGHLIADVARLGHLSGSVLDVTWGFGTFWKVWQPDELYGCDLVTELSPIGRSVDFRRLPMRSRSFDVVVFDPPYKLNGRPDPVVDERYGVHLRGNRETRLNRIMLGVDECCRVARDRVLVKCMDQVEGGRMRWQTLMVVRRAEAAGFSLIDRFDLIGHHRPQPMNGRRQQHAHGRGSTLLVFRRAS